MVQKLSPFVRLKPLDPLARGLAVDVLQLLLDLGAIEKDVWTDGLEDRITEDIRKWIDSNGEDIRSWT